MFNHKDLDASKSQIGIVRHHNWLGMNEEPTLTAAPFKMFSAYNCLESCLAMTRLKGFRAFCEVFEFGMAI
jgi:hypothetical protein